MKTVKNNNPTCFSRLINSIYSSDNNIYYSFIKNGKFKLNKKILLNFIEHGLNVNQTNNKKNTIFHCVEFTTGALKLALKHGFNINAQNCYDDSIFCEKRFSLKSFKFAYKNGFTLFFLPLISPFKTSRKKAIKITKFYISQKPTPIIPGSLKNEPLFLDDEAVQMILDKGLSLNEALNELPGEPILVKYVLERGADPNLKNEKGEFVAFDFYNDESIKLAIEKGFDYKNAKKWKKDIFQISNFKDFKYLIDIKYDLNSKTEDGRTIVHGKSNYITDEIYEMLKEYGFELAVNNSKKDFMESIR